MPRETIDLPYTIDHLSILDQQGNVDNDLEPAIDEQLLKKLHRFMLLSRRFDERLLSLQRQGRMGTFAPIKGQEAAQLGAVAVLEEQDWLFPSFREMAAELWRGKAMENVLLVYAGYNEGGFVAEGQRNLPVCIPVGTQLPYAGGMMYAAKYRRTDEIGMAFFGDGATSEGDFHETMNFAGVFQIPLVFVCQNNQWAISLPVEKQTASDTIAQKSKAFGFPGIKVDGNDVLAVYTAAKEALNGAKEGKGPTLIEAETYRLGMHTTADDPTRYRTDEELKEWEEKDPLKRFKFYLKNKGIWTERWQDDLEEKANKKIEEAIDKAENYDEHSPEEMFEHIYSDMSENLSEELEYLKKSIEEKEIEEEDTEIEGGFP